MAIYVEDDMTGDVAYRHRVEGNVHDCDRFVLYVTSAASHLLPKNTVSETEAARSYKKLQEATRS